MQRPVPILNRIPKPILLSRNTEPTMLKAASVDFAAVLDRFAMSRQSKTANTKLFAVGANNPETVLVSQHLM